MIILDIILWLDNNEVFLFLPNNVNIVNHLILFHDILILIEDKSVSLIIINEHQVLEKERERIIKMLITKNNFYYPIYSTLNNN